MNNNVKLDTKTVGNYTTFYIAEDIRIIARNVPEKDGKFLWYVEKQTKNSLNWRRSKTRHAKSFVDIIEKAKAMTKDYELRKENKVKKHLKQKQEVLKQLGIVLTFKEKETLYNLKTETAIDSYCRTIIRDKL